MSTSKSKTKKSKDLSYLDLINPAMFYRPLGVTTPSNSMQEEIFSDYNLKKSKLKKHQFLCPSLHFQKSKKDLGWGGFYSGGFIPPFWNIEGTFSRKNPLKDINFYWPKDYLSGKRMKYLGSINVDNYSNQLSNFQFVEEKWKTKLNFYGTDARGYPRMENEHWFHFFASEKNEYSSFVPDCHVIMHSRLNFRKEFCFDESPISKSFRRRREAEENELKETHFSQEEYEEEFRRINEEETNKTDIVTPSCFFQKPDFFFERDFCPPNGDNFWDIDEDFDFYNYPKESVIKFLGCPESQQEPKRYLSPNSYPIKRACVPFISFSDDEHDMTHQMYVDSFYMDTIHHTSTYCKLDSSCT